MRRKSKLTVPLKWHGGKPYLAVAEIWPDQFEQLRQAIVKMVE